MIGEDTAVLAMKSGADDYLRKDNLKRLVPAIERELEDVGIRRKKRVVEDRLQKSEARYRMLFARMMDGFALLEYMDTGADRAPDFIFIDLNDAFASTLGLTREDIIAKTVREVYPEVMEELLVRYRSVALTGESMHFEQYSPASRNYFEISAYRPRAGQVATIIKDVTARKVESERQALLGYILETINREANTQTIIQDIISLIKHHYGFDAVGLRFRQNGDYPYYEHDGLSDAFLETEISLCSRDELGAPLSDSDGTPSLECLCGIVLKGKTDASNPYFTEGGSFWSNDLELLSASLNDSTLDTTFRGRCVREGYKSLALIPLRSGEDNIGLLQLISFKPNMFSAPLILFFESIGLTLGIALKRRKIEEEVQESEEKYRSLVETTPCIICKVDPGGKTLFVNSYVETVTGYAADDLVGRDWFETFYPGQSADQLALMMKAFEDGDVHGYEMTLTGRDGGQRSIYWDSFNTWGPNGELIEINGVGVDITERKRLEEERDHILNLSQDLICIAGMDGYFKYVNPAWVFVLGYSQAELLSRPYLDFVHPDDHGRNDAEVARMKAGHKMMDFENRYVHRDGSVRIINWRGVPLPDRHLMYCIGRDVTEERNAGAALQESREQYRLLVENMGDAVLLTEPGGTIFSVNQAGCRMFGRTEEEICRLGRVGIIDKTDPRLAAALEERARTGRFKGELTGLRANGEKFPIEVSTTLFKNRSGEDRTAMIISDISERVRAEKALRESEEKYRLLADNVDDIVWTMGLDLRTTYVSPSVMKVLGFTPEERIMQSPSEQVTPESYELLTRRLRDEMALEEQGAADRSRSVTLEAEFYRHDGSTVWLESVITAIRDADGRIERLLGVSRDITERRRINASLVEKSRDLALSEQQARYQFRFLYVVINSINAPIFFKDDGGHYSGCNTAFEEFVDLPMSEIVGKTVYDIWPPDLAGSYDRMDRELLAAGGTQTREMQMHLPDGSYRDVILSTAVYPSKNGTAGGVVGVMLDITDRKRAEEAVRESERFAQSTVNALDANIAILAGTGEIISVNRAWREFALENGGEHARVFEDANYLAVCDFATGTGSEGAAEFAAGIRSVMTGAAETYMQEYPCHAPFANRWFVGKVTRFPGEGPLRIVVAHTEITERKLAEEKIAASLHEKEALLREIHHRVKNNMQVISSLIGLQNSYITRGANVGVALGEMQNRIKSMAIVHEKLYRSENLARIDFREYVTSLSMSIFQSLSVDPDRVALQLDVGAVTLGIDEAVPCGLLVNELVTNALKHGFPGGRTGVITVSMTDTGGGTYRISVRDDGVGLPEAFDVAAAGSLGVRLIGILTKQIGGSLEVRSEQGRGAEFIITFPAGKEARSHEGE